MPISRQNVAAACDSDPSLNWLYASSGTVWLLGEASRIGMSRLPEATIPVMNHATTKAGRIRRSRMPVVARKPEAPAVRAASSSSREICPIGPVTARLAIGVVPTISASSTIHCVAYSDRSPGTDRYAQIRPRLRVIPGTAHKTQIDRSGSRRSRDVDRWAVSATQTPSAAALNPATTATSSVVSNAELVPGACSTVE